MKHSDRLHDTPSGQTNYQHPHSAKWKRRRKKFSRKPVPLAREDAEHLIDEARSLFASMSTYDVKRADAIAVALFSKLTSPFRNHPTLLNRMSGISEVSLWKWTTRRVALNVETVSKHSDRLAKSFGLSLRLSDEAANLMSGIPWKGKKTGRQLLRYAVQYQLSARSLLHLARRQDRMNITAFTRKMGISKDVFHRMLHPPAGDVSDTGRRASAHLTSIARRFGLTMPDEIAEFRLLVMHGNAKPLVLQSELQRAFRHESCTETRHSFLRRFVTLLRKRHGLLSRRSLANAVWDQAFPLSAQASASMSIEEFKQRLDNSIRPNDPCTHLPEDWSDAMAKFAFPDTKDRTIRQALARYLKNRDGDRTGKRKTRRHRDK